MLLSGHRRSPDERVKEFNHQHHRYQLPTTSLIRAVEMAHNLAGDICKFTVIEHQGPEHVNLATGAPSMGSSNKPEQEHMTSYRYDDLSAIDQEEIITNQQTNELFEFGEIKSPASSRETLTKIEEVCFNKEEEEDLITVRYLPLKMSVEDHEQQTRLSPDERPANYTGHSVADEDEEEEQQVRIVEHIKKNLTLFESSKHIYQVTPSIYQNHKGHLQSLLVQKHSPKAQKHGFIEPKEVRIPSLRTASVSDQYTQYRISDLIASQPADARGQTTNVQPAKTEVVNQPIESAQEEKTKSSLASSIGQLIRKPISFVKRSRTLSSKESIRKKDNQRPGDPLTEEPRYKVPPRQQYLSAQNIFLTPAPDYRVHIATRSLFEIVQAHQRIVQRRLKNSTIHKTASNDNSGPRSRHQASRLSQLFSTNSLRRSNRSSSRDRQSRTLPKNFSRRENQTRKRDPLYGQTDNSISRIKARVRMPSAKIDKANIVDNKDGTIKILYEPKEVGQHELLIRYDDEPIDEAPLVFYVDAVGASKKKITAYGSGLSKGIVGEQCKFTINTGGLGSSKLNVAVEGPSKAQVSLSDNKDGTIGVSYLPLMPGEYKVKIGFDGKQVAGSPFVTEISDEGRQKSRLAVDLGSEHALDLKISEDEMRTLDAMIVTPSGVEEPCRLKLMKNNQIAIVFTPREQGDHLVNVRRRGNHISGSPFKFDVLSRDIGDAKQVRVSGKNLKEAKANADNEITINTKEAGFGDLSISLEGPGRADISTKELMEGSIKVVFKPREPGHYSLALKYADHVVPGSPFNIKVTGQGSKLQKETLRRYRKACQQVDINEECCFSIKQPGTSAFDLSAKLHSPQGNAEDVSIKDKGDYVYQVSFVPKEVGLYSLSIRNKDMHTAGSPFPFTVGPLLDFGPHKVRCGGPGLIKGICGKWNEFNVYTREAGAGQLQVLVEGPSKAELNYTDRKDGSCHVGYKVSEPGEYCIKVIYDDHQVPESPFRAYIMPASGDVSKIELGPMPPESMIQLNKPCNFTVIMNGAKGNIEAQVVLPNGKREDCFASPIDAENWGVRFIPREFGVHQVHIKFNKGSSHIPQSPVFVRVGHDKADPASVMVHGQGLKQSIVNHATDFIVETCNAGHALLEVNIEGPSKVSMGCSEVDEGYRIHYTPLAPGDYLISIKYNSCHIGSSPFKVRAVKQPGSRTVADPGSQELATISVATTDREAKQKVENMPKFKSDASRVYCKGMGLKKAFAGKPNTLTVNCSEAGFNMIYASFLGPTRNTIYECSAKHMGGSIYEIRYVCKDRGDAILVVKYGDEQIPGSPFRLECV